MKTIGLTGGFGTGKSTVLGLLARSGMDVCDTDDLARQVVMSGRPAWKKIVRVFGKKILRPDCSLDRRQMAEVVFADSRKRESLNRIVHPEVLKLIERFVRDCKRRSRPWCAVAVPLLYEEKLEGCFDVVVVVCAGRDHVLRRVGNARVLSRRQMLARIRAQMPLEEKCGRADVVLNNDGTKRRLEKQVRDLLDKLKNFGVENDCHGRRSGACRTGS